MVTLDSGFEKAIYRAQAYDKDEETTCNGEDICPCSDIHYSLDNDYGGAFNIDKTTGVIAIVPSKILPEWKTYVLKVHARNPTYQSNEVETERSSMTLTVQIAQDLPNGEEQLVEALEEQLGEESKWSESFGGMEDLNSIDEPHSRMKRVSTLNTIFFVQKWSLLK